MKSSSYVTLVGAQREGYAPTSSVRHSLYLTLLSLFLLFTTALANAVVRDISTGLGINSGAMPDTMWQVDQVGGGEAPAQTVFPGNGDWSSAWAANNPPNSSWIARDANSCCSGSVPYTFTTSFYVDNANIASISGSWTIDDQGTLALNGRIIDALGSGSSGSLHAFSAAGNSFFVPGLNILTITITASNHVHEGVRLQGSVTNATAAGWQPLSNQPPATVGPMLQLRDGRILVHEEQSGNAAHWWILTPDANGSYLNGTWSSGGSLQAGYAPFYFSSQVMLDGRVLIEGGEYNNGSAAWTTLGALGTVTPYGAVNWVANAPPSGWSTIGDAQSIILPNGMYMQANCCTPQNALYTGPNSWVATGSVKASRNDEQGWTLLPDGDVLTVDVTPACGSNTSSELYHNSKWQCNTPVGIQLYNSNDQELGAAVLMYNGKVLQFGGLPSATAIYDTGNDMWTAGPTPTGLNQADGPAALEPDGKVLAMLSPGLFSSGCQMLEYDPSVGTIGALSNAPNPLNCPSDSSFYGHLMILPTGQIMFTDLSNRVEIYTPAGGYLAATPNIAAISTLTISKSSNINKVLGYNLNGLTQNNGYGDDYQGDTNYPLGRLICGGTVYFVNTHNENTHSIYPGTIVTSYFGLDPATPLGVCSFQAIANGVPGNISTITVVP